MRMQRVSAATILGTVLSIAAFVAFGADASPEATTTTPVTVENTGSHPVITEVRPVDNPAKNVVQFRAYIEIPDGASSASQAIYTVPTGKRLVIQTVSIYRSGTVTPGTSVQLYIDGSFGGAASSLALPSIAAGGMDPGATLSATYYADPNTAVEVFAYRTSNSGDEFDYVTIVGYLVSGVS